MIKKNVHAVSKSKKLMKIAKATRRLGVRLREVGKDKMAGVMQGPGRMFRGENRRDREQPVSSFGYHPSP